MLQYLPCIAVTFLISCSFLCIIAVELATLTREKGKTIITVLKDKKVEALIKVHEEEEAKIEAEKKKADEKKK